MLVPAVAEVLRARLCRGYEDYLLPRKFKICWNLPLQTSSLVHVAYDAESTQIDITHGDQFYSCSLRPWYSCRLALLSRAGQLMYASQTIVSEPGQFCGCKNVGSGCLLDRFRKVREMVRYLKSIQTPKRSSTPKTRVHMW